MRAGELDRRVTIQRLSEAQDASGYEAQSWKDVDTVWANIAAVSGTEYRRGIQVEAGITTIVEMRFNNITSQITSKMRLKYKARLLNVERAYDPEEARKRIVCQCKEVA